MCQYRIVKAAAGYNPDTKEFSYEYSPEVMVEGIESDAWICILFTNKVYGCQHWYPSLEEALHIIEKHKIKMLVDDHPEEMIYID